MFLTDKTALITGASGGIGRATALKLAAEGATIVAGYNSNSDAAQAVAREIQDTGGRATTVRADLADSADIRNLYSSVVEQHDGLDIVVNNAAVFLGAPIQYAAETDIDALIAINVKGLMISLQEAARHLRDGGRIVNISARVPAPARGFLGLYGSTKTATDTLTRTLAHELGHRGITVNAVAPGPTDTAMLAPEARAGLPAIIEQTSLGRLGHPADIAAAIAWLTHPDTAWITGQTINASGGFE